MTKDDDRVTALKRKIANCSKPEHAGLKAHLQKELTALTKKAKPYKWSKPEDDLS